ncbi:type II secretion system F family protein [Streptomyces rimosus]|uniref:type II secretion system F family protein n=1 Tax=Streptomyces rimosus TaxID=1927 RepID=UPI0004CBF2E2|nr:type II secretion system F family protein [Streptomyces rimosus]
MSQVGVAVVASVPVCAAVLCAGVAVWVSGGRSDDVRRARLLFVGTERAGAATASVAPGGEQARIRQRLKKAREKARLWFHRRELWCIPAGFALAVLSRSVLPVVAAVVSLALIRRRLRARERVRERECRGDAVIELCEAVAGELRGGRQPGQALVEAGAAGFGEAGTAVVAAARFGGDVPRALRAAARLPGAEGLAGVAACWQVAVDGGAGLAAGLERIASGLRARRDQRDDLRAQLAGPRATALMLALLPVGGLAMGSALGADPLTVLLHTPAGWACLLVGGLLEWCGVVWTARIIRAAEGSTHVH